MHDNSPERPSNAVTQVKTYLLNLQQTICEALEAMDGGKTFQRDPWTRAQGGGGLTNVMENGLVFEKAGVNFSHVTGDSLPAAANNQRTHLSGYAFEAMGVSLVIHPHNPYVPTSHANVRFFIAEKEGSPTLWWFGGGLDLTPYYGFVKDCQHWHQTAAQSCAPFGESLYAQFKAACDQYFFLAHRQEARGIGGLFFDDYCAHSFEHSFDLTRSIGDHFLHAYLPIVERRKHISFGEREKQFQRYRRGRYVEFNLIYDRGTLFGLQSQGRTESILMSLPPDVHWAYQWHPIAGSPEEALYTEYLPARDWLQTITR